MDSIRQADQGRIRPDDRDLLESESISIEFDDPEGICINSKLEQTYPFNEQLEFSGTIEYQKQTSISVLQPDPEEYEFTYRTGSRLFILEGEMPDTKARSIIKELDDRLESSSNDKLRFVDSNREGLWSFILTATDRTQIVAKDGLDEVGLDELEDKSLEEIARRYLVDRARLVFYYQDERINVSYEDGRLNFRDSVSSDGKEYVIQLFEKYVVNGDRVEELE